MNADIVPVASIVTGVEQGIYAEVEKSPVFEMYSEAPEIADVWQNFVCRMNDQELKGVACSESFFSYCAGVACLYQVGEFEADAATYEEQSDIERRHLCALTLCYKIWIFLNNV